MVIQGEVSHGVFHCEAQEVLKEVPGHLSTPGAWSPQEPSERNSCPLLSSAPTDKTTPNYLAKGKHLQSSSLLSQSRLRRVGLELKGNKLITGTEDNTEVF